MKINILQPGVFYFIEKYAEGHTFVFKITNAQ
jgi:hypothetical protein